METAWVESRPLLSGSSEIAGLAARIEELKRDLFASEKEFNNSVNQVQEKCSHPGGFTVEVGFPGETGGWVRTGFVCDQCGKKVSKRILPQ